MTYNGKPIEKGTITFTADGRAPSAIDIVDGKFAGQAMIGSNRVSVAAYRKSGKEHKLPASAQATIQGQMKAYAAKSGGGGSTEVIGPDMEDYIPPEWGRESKQMRVVERGGANKFDIDIKGK